MTSISCKLGFHDWEFLEEYYKPKEHQRPDGYICKCAKCGKMSKTATWWPHEG